MHQVAVHERVLQQRRNRIHVILAHLADILKQETQALQHAVLHVQLRHAVLVHQRGQDREWRASLGNDGDGNSGTHTDFKNEKRVRLSSKTSATILTASCVWQQRSAALNTPILPFLNFQVVQQRSQDVLRANGLGNVPEGVYSGSSDPLLVGL
ncbi:MAG: hypothetical protein BJ554DRAFT_793 [Olpidium bornovanus]|uniref:Uncharacterized protein n=1 Tax=Olpidium bornovanus TaxID=278681 RepID=A0A8H7ZT50_9FUNG|nr:MAG: hypothetical protein BJ554DRAFT_793 [Olpidium bornovanus]